MNKKHDHATLSPIRKSICPSPLHEPPTPPDMSFDDTSEADATVYVQLLLSEIESDGRSKSQQIPKSLPSATRVRYSLD